MTPRYPHRPPIAQAGFSLIEMLIAISVLAIVMSLSFGTLRFVGAAWDRGDTAITVSEDLAVTDRILRTWLQSAVLPVEDAEPSGQGVFSGDPQEIKFYVFRPPYPVEGGLFHARIWLEAGSDNVSLKLALTPFDQPDQPGPDHVVAQLPSGSQFSFFGGSDGSGSDWSSDWQSATQLPTLIRLAPASPDADTLWPALIFATETNMPHLCFTQANDPGLALAPHCEALLQ